MTCDTCLATQPIPLCISAIVLGQISDINTAVIVKIKNEATQRIDNIESTSNGSGIITVDVSTLEFMESHYTFSVHKPDEYSNDLDITIGGEQAKCIDFVFENCNETVAEVELEIID